MTLLIVDDNQRIREMIKQIVQGITDEVYECSDGAEAVEAFTRFRPTVVLMDIKMNNMDGITAAQNILRIDSRAIVILVTDYGDEPFRVAAARAGVAEYVLKENMIQLPSILHQYQ